MGEEVQEAQNDAKDHPYMKIVIISVLAVVLLVLIIIAFTAFKNISHSFAENKMKDLKPDIGESCGDGSCTNTELSRGSCPTDCQSEIQVIEIGSCGDEICDLNESSNNSCPQDCE